MCEPTAGVHSRGLGRQMKMHVLQSRTAQRVGGRVTCQQTDVSVLARRNRASYAGNQGKYHADTYMLVTLVRTGCDFWWAIYIRIPSKYLVKKIPTLPSPKHFELARLLINWTTGVRKTAPLPPLNSLVVQNRIIGLFLKSCPDTFEAVCAWMFGPFASALRNQ